jgi:hypothetical protein
MAKYSHRTSLVLDDDDEEDRKILERQRAAARDAGKSGRDRAGSTAGRADLESAFDEGARGTASPSVGTGPGTGGATKKSAPAPGSKGRTSKGPSVGATVGSIPRPTLRPPRTPVGGKDWAGFALGLVLHALVVSYIRYGKAGPKGWLAAKFLNKPIQGDDLEHENRKDQNNGVDPKPSGHGANGELPAEGHLDPSMPIM